MAEPSLSRCLQYLGSAGRASERRTERARDVDTVPFPVFRRDVLTRAGRFSEELRRNQDDEYSFRLRDLGYRVVLEPRMRTRYFSRRTLWGAFRQYLGYGFWKVQGDSDTPSAVELPTTSCPPWPCWVRSL